MKLKIKMSKKNKIYLISFLFIFVFILTAFKSIPNVKADDNYSTYLYNQDINIDKDSAHLFTKNSDGSNSYRNLFQSNFLFPAKLQSNMLSTFPTSEFSRYSFNQFHFNNLDNNYNYGSNNNSENLYQNIPINDYSVNSGVLLQKGNTSNYQDYNGTYSFENDIIGNSPLEWSSQSYNIIFKTICSIIILII